MFCLFWLHFKRSLKTNNNSFDIPYVDIWESVEKLDQATSLSWQRPKYFFTFCRHCTLIIFEHNFHQDPKINCDCLVGSWCLSSIKNVSKRLERGCIFNIKTLRLFPNLDRIFLFLDWTAKFLLRWILTTVQSWKRKTLLQQKNFACEFCHFRQTLFQPLGTFIPVFKIALTTILGVKVHTV